MHFFALERPEASPQNKAWLLDGSALPVITVRVQGPEAVQLLLMLRNYNAGSNFTYSYHYINLKPTELNAFFTSYIDDPEGTIERYAGWKPQAASRAWSPSDFAKVSRAEGAGGGSKGPIKPVLSAENKALMDLL
jgi:hypothetical protein